MYLTDSKEEAESYLKEAGKSHEWHGDDLAVWYTLPTTRKHGKTGIIRAYKTAKFDRYSVE